MTIAARQGAAEIVLPEAFTIPPAGSVEIPLADVVMDGKTVYYLPTADDGKVIPRNTALGGWNPVTICGVKGTLTVGVDSTVWPQNAELGPVHQGTGRRRGPGEGGGETALPRPGGGGGRQCVFHRHQRRMER